MIELHNKHCVPCEGHQAPLTADEIKPLLHRLEDWKISDNKRIHKEFEFKDFREAMGFMNEVGDVAEYENHHPDLNLHNWNKVTVTLSTHALKGLSENDFIMAAKIDRTLAEMKE